MRDQYFFEESIMKAKAEKRLAYLKEKEKELSLIDFSPDSNTLIRCKTIEQIERYKKMFNKKNKIVC